MQNLNMIVANNLVNLRKTAKLTQLEFGEKFNYSNKTVSKWEMGTMIPSVDILKEIADYYGITVDYILTEHKNEKDYKTIVGKRISTPEKYILICLFITIIWTIAAVIYAARSMSHDSNHPWLSFVWAVPTSSFVAAFFSRRYFKNTTLSLIFVSIFVWTILAASFVHTFVTSKENYWFLFIVGIPVQTLLILLMLKKKMKN